MKKCFSFPPGTAALFCTTRNHSPPSLFRSVSGVNRRCLATLQRGQHDLLACLRGRLTFPAALIASSGGGRRRVTSDGRRGGREKRKRRGSQHTPSNSGGRYMDGGPQRRCQKMRFVLPSRPLLFPFQDRPKHHHFTIFLPLPGAVGICPWALHRPPAP